MTAADFDPVISDPPSDDVLANRLRAAVPELDNEDVARDVVRALRSAETNGWMDDRFRRQLGHRLQQAQLAASRDDK